ncbi:MAG: glycosyltransferase family 2 protein [Halobacteriovoraceae bacterium]|nr:glycosyltransferase family 2 protein [Halobacteriovoraceae bacterium]
MRKTVACVIPVKNVEKIIRGAIDSVAFCDEVILVDMFSTDKTKEIANEYPNVRFFERQSYIYDNFNFGMDKAKSEYIIRLDSDERLSPKLQEEILSALSEKETKEIYKAPYYSYFLGKALLNGGKFATREILFKKGVLRYPVKTEHDGFENISGRNIEPGIFQGAYEHYSCPSIKKYIEKINYYSEKDIERLEKNTKVFSPLRIVYASTRYFFRNYFSHGGYKDGYHGFCIALLDSMYFATNFLKIWEKKEKLKEFHDEERDKYDEMLRNYAKEKGYIS